MIKIIPAILPSSYRAIELGVDTVFELVDTVQVDFVDGQFAGNRTWWFNNKEVHEVINNSADDRIHMVVDIRTSR